MDSPQLISELVFPTGNTIRESLYLLSQQSRNLLTNLATDLSTQLLNFRNLTTQHLPKVGSFIYVTDRLVYKQINSLTRALGRVISVKDRSVEISGWIIKRNYIDIMSCDGNGNSKGDIDVLDFPLYSRTIGDDLTNNQSV